MKTKILLLLCLFGLMAPIQAKHRNFTVSVYVRAYEVEKMKDTEWLTSTWNIISEQLDVDKIYLETHRDLLIVDDATIEKAKKFFMEQGIEVAGGITYTINEANNFETFCYSDPEHRRIVQQIAEHTARHFDEFLLDDFFFTSCKSEAEIAAKGNRSWTEYRLALMNEAGKNLVVDPAHHVNPKVKVIIKYPNWYDHFQGLGFNLQDGPQIFDGVWTGTETRDPAGAQHLQNYLSYNVMRYYENLSGGRNGGGWVDAGGISMSMDRYAEQLHLTAIAKARDVMLFAYNQLIDVKLSPRFRASWQDGKTSWNYDEMTSTFRSDDGKRQITPTTMARIADVVLRQADNLVGKLGNPVGICNYKPFHSSGEGFLQNYLGMIGLPMDMRCSYPEEKCNVVLLTAQAAADADIMSKVEQSLRQGGNVVITSGLLKAIPEKIAEVCELQCDDLKALVNDFGNYGQSTRDILIPQIRYFTNDSWEIISAGRPLQGGVSGYPILHRALYGGGNLYVLTIPDDFGQLYDYPAGALNAIRRVLSQDLDFSLEAPSKVGLFLYDNKTVIVENFNDLPVEISLVCNGPFETLTDLEDSSAKPISSQAGKVFSGWRATDVRRFTLTLPPHSYHAYKYK
ncbi:hypothetical protein AAE250_00835 [Bacteroides sp. GD17]|jgi:hypothetical protein|uniref:hypothetical protein n=1 Tax=Bacteroides sp. GD17 TaxID=3139826 RepID=UPI0025F8B255|nr:hypothetical protein [uncultured Bacteroides sp.]